MAVAALFGPGNSTTAAAATGTMITANKPANVADGDLLVALAYSQFNGPVTAVPAGWTLVPGTAFTQRAGGFYYKPVTQAAAESGPYAWSFTATGRMTAQVFRVTGANLNNPVDAVGALAAQTATSTTLPSVTASDATLLLAGAYWNNSVTTPSTFATPAGMTDGQQVASPSTANTSGTDVAWQPITTAGPTGTRTFTTNPASANAAGIMFTIAPQPTNAAGTLALTGSGTLTLAGSAKATGALTLSGSGALTLAVTPTPAGTLERTAEGRLTLTGAVATADTLTLTGAGTLTLTGYAQGPASNITATGTLEPRRWATTLPQRQRTGTLEPRRWAGSI